MVEMIGNQASAQQVWQTIQQWDQAVVELDIQTLTDLCQPDVKMFDLSSEIEGVEQYRQLWQQHSRYFFGHFYLQRRDIKIYAQDDLAFVCCHSKVSYSEKMDADWCRTSMCFQRQSGAWRLSHQHISLPQQIAKSVYQ